MKRILCQICCRIKELAWYYFPYFVPLIIVVLELRPFIRNEVERQLNFERQDSEGEHPKSADWRKNFAAASAGARVISASKTCTEFHENKAFFGFFPAISNAPPPITALQSWNEYEECWPMQGSKGHLLVQLAGKIFVHGFTLEHVDATTHLGGLTAEAPRNFTVYGLTHPNEADSSRHLLGVFQYDNKQGSRQTYETLSSTQSFFLIDLVIGSNHGHPRYTCIYRFKVHGELDMNHCSAV